MNAVKHYNRLNSYKWRLASHIVANGLSDDSYVNSPIFEYNGKNYGIELEKIIYHPIGIQEIISTLVRSIYQFKNTDFSLCAVNSAGATLCTSLMINNLINNLPCNNVCALRPFDNVPITQKEIRWWGYPHSPLVIVVDEVRPDSRIVQYIDKIYNLGYKILGVIALFDWKGFVVQDLAKQYNIVYEYILDINDILKGLEAISL